MKKNFIIFGTTSVLLMTGILLSCGGPAATEPGDTADTIKPQLVIVFPGSNQVVSPNFTILGTASDNKGVQAVKVNPGNGIFTNAAGTTSWSYDISGASSGSMTVKAYAVDTSGNTGITQTVIFTVDADKPSLSITSPTNGQVLASNFTIGGTAADNNSVQTVKVDPGTGVFSDADGTGTWTYDVDDASTGVLTLRAYSMDHFGNSSITQTVQVYVNLWAKTYGGTGNEIAYSILQASDSGYTVTGYSTSFGSGDNDIWMLKLNNTGTPEWQKIFGGNGNETAYSVGATSDGGYIITGEKFYTIGTNAVDLWLIKIDGSGNTNWEKTYGAGGYEYGYSAEETSDGGYIVAGYTSSFGALGSWDIWILKLDANGNTNWQKVYRGNGEDYAYSIHQTSDDGYIVAGNSKSFSSGCYYYLVMKLDSLGDIEWQKNIGAGWDDFSYSIRQTADGGYIVVGYGYYLAAGYYRILLVKFDSSGSVSWQKMYGGGDSDYAEYVGLTSDGGYILGGYTYSFGAGSLDAIIIKLDSGGNTNWAKVFGGTGDDRVSAVAQTADGGYIVAGRTASFGMGNYDMWILKLDENGEIPGASFMMTAPVSVINYGATVKSTNATILETLTWIIDTGDDGINSSAVIKQQYPE